MSYKIITHNGKAHLDELLASALLALHLGDKPDSIERLDFRDAAEMAASEKLPEDTYFIDCGLVYDRKRKLYDHHQDKDLDSTALLIFNEFFPHLKNTDLHNFMKLVSRVDTGGPMSLDDFEHTGESREYFLFSHNILLKTFEEEPMAILKIFTSGLEDKIRFERSRHEAVLWLGETGHIEIAEINGMKILKYLIKPPSGLVSALRSAASAIVEESNITAILSFDDKQPGVRTFYRTDPGHNIIDFSRCSPAETVFSHQGGFLLKFVPSDEEEWIKLIQQAVL